MLAFGFQRPCFAQVAGAIEIVFSFVDVFRIDFEAAAALVDFHVLEERRFQITGKLRVANTLIPHCLRKARTLLQIKIYARSTTIK